MINKQDILNAREQIQEDLLCLLDGLSEEAHQVSTRACQIVVDNFKKMVDNDE